MFVLAASVELRIPHAQSLKTKRAALKPVVEGLRNRYSVAVAEVDHQDVWQRACIGVTTVASTPGHAEEVMDTVERFVWSQAGIEVLEIVRHWMEIER